jgi:DNA-binding HxlR family transcriptional regulator
MKGYGQFCPIAVACETFAERWTPLILRELLAGAQRFNDIRQGIPMISRTLLSQRLRELEDARILESAPLARGRGREYRPTRAAQEFSAVLERLGEWGQRWGTTQFDPENLDLDPPDVERAPADRLRSPSRPAGRGALRLPRVPCALPRLQDVLADPRASRLGCLPEASGVRRRSRGHRRCRAMARVWTGAVTFAQATRSGGLQVEGPRDLVRAFPTWLLLSHFAHVERPAVSTATGAHSQ